MRLEGIHHITAITADARANVDFYARLLGLRLVKKTVNFDAPDVYHLYYGDEQGSPGSILTFFEFPGAPLGRPGDGMIHTISMRVGDDSALDFWRSRLEAGGVVVEDAEGRLAFAGPEGLRFELIIDRVPDPPLVAAAPDVPAAHALCGFAGVRAYAADPDAAGPLLEGALGFTRLDDAGHLLAGEARRATYGYNAPPDRPGLQGAGTVHHIAWSARDEDEQRVWRQRVADHGGRPTPIIDRTYFHSVYFREPSGVLFELATRGPGFAVDEPPERLGEALMLPERYEPMRAQLERTLTPLANPRAGAAAR